MRTAKKRERVPLGRSKGVFSFKTKDSDLYCYAPIYRSMAESGRYDYIASSIRADETMVSASGGAWSPSAQFWDSHQIEVFDCWSEYSFLQDRVQKISGQIAAGLQRVYSTQQTRLGHEDFRKHYIPLYWETVLLTRDVILDKANSLMHDEAAVPDVPMGTFALGKVNSRWVLFARRGWLETFRAGLQLMLYYNMACRRNFEKVYGFK